MKIVAVSGWKRSGKDTLCDYLTNHGATRVSFADPLKDMVSEEYGIPRADLDDQSKKEAPILSLPVDPQDAFTRAITQLMVREFRTADGRAPEDFDFSCNEGLLVNDGGIVIYEPLFWTPRALAIFKGSGNRSVDPDYWTRQAINKIWTSQDGLVVIPDLRFKSEVSQLKKVFGDDLTTVRINRFDRSPSTDASERDLDNAEFNHIIENRGTLEEFYAKIDTMLRYESVLWF
jgi:hypothetical protein